MTDTPTPTEPAATGAAGAGDRRTLDFLALGLVVVSALLLVGGILFQVASADARGANAGATLQSLAQAANPFIAALALAATVIVVQEREDGRARQVAAAAVMAVATIVNLTVALLALSGVVDDFSRQVPAMFKVGTVLGRLATVALSGIGVWLAATGPPARRSATPDTPPDQRTSSTL